MSKTRTTIRLFWFILGAGLFGYLLTQQDWQGFADLGPALLLASLLAMVGQIGVLVMDALSWRQVLPTRPPPPLPIMIKIRLVGESYNAIIPLGGMGGEPVKLWMLHTNAGIPWIDGFISIVAGRWVNMVASLPYTLAGLIALFFLASPPGLVWLTLSGAFLFMLVATTLLYGAQLWTHRIGHLLRKYMTPSQWPENMEALGNGFSHLYSSRYTRIRKAVAISVVQWQLGSLEILAALWVTGNTSETTLLTGLVSALALESAVILTRAASFMIPASLGAQEAVILALASPLFDAGPVGLMIIATKRIRELSFILLGLAWRKS